MKKIALILVFTLILSVMAPLSAVADNTRPVAVDNNGFCVDEDEFMEMLLDMMNGKYPELYGYNFDVELYDSTKDEGFSIYSIIATNFYAMISFLNADASETDKDDRYDDVLVVVNTDEIEKGEYWCILIATAIALLTNKELDDCDEAMQYVLDNFNGSEDQWTQTVPMEYNFTSITGMVIFAAREIEAFK